MSDYQYIICKNDFPAFVLPLGTSENLAKMKLVELKQSEFDSRVYWHLQQAKILKVD
jgi:hypothetical protein